MGKGTDATFSFATEHSQAKTLLSVKPVQAEKLTQLENCLFDYFKLVIVVC
jgi:hypothetical protein